MLLDMAVADAYGAGFEFVPLVKHHPNTGRNYYQHPELPLGGGRYTDDTAQAMAVSFVILEHEIPEQSMFAKEFVNSFHGNPRAGYARRFVNFMRGTHTAADFRQNVRNDSTRSGAAMRSGPIGFYNSIDQVKAVTLLQASLTHNTPEAISAAQAVALTTHYLAYNLGRLCDLGLFLEDTLGAAYPWNTPWIEMTGDSWVTVEGLDCAHAAVSALMDHGSQTEILRRCIAYGGDVDTVAAIALFPSSLCTEIELDLDASLYEGLENGTYGREALIRLDEELIKFARQQGATIPE